MKPTRALAVDLYRQICSQPGNLLISPYSIWLAVAMLHPGARGRTRDRLSAVLGIDDVAAVARLRGELAKRAEPTAWQRDMVERGYQTHAGFGFHLEVANKLWVQSGYRITPEYGARLAEAFGVDPAPVDFADAPDAACAAINRWVDDQTHGRIKNIVSSRGLIPQLRALLANAIYFKAGWADEFSERGTAPLPFHRLDGTTATVPMMWRVASFGHAEDDDLTAVQLHYVQPDVAMVVLVPRAGAFADVERTLTLDRIDRIIGTLEPAQISLKLPKFKFETALTIAGALREIGLADVLSPTADLSGISDDPGFGVGEVLHKTFIDVNEKGTEAAAVTAMLMELGRGPRDPLQVVVDRPFYVLIRDIPTGTALFFGRVVDP